MEIVLENSTKRKLLLELLIILTLGIVVYIFSSIYDMLEQIVEFSRLHEDWEIDEIITMMIFLAFALAFFSLRRKKELEKAISEIRQLRGIIPICSECKKIRDDAGCWHQIESYVRRHSEAEFSHGICPDCIKKLYPDIEDEED